MFRCLLISWIIVLALAFAVGCSAMSNKGAAIEKENAQNTMADSPVSAADSQEKDFAARSDLDQECVPTEVPFPGIAEQDLWIVEKQDGVISKKNPTQGEIRINAGKRTCLALQNTDVSVNISAFVAVVNVTQRFYNPYLKNIEAYYVFPLPHNAAITDFTITIGKRHIRGLVREREQAQRIYRAAKKQGYRAVLLSQRQTDVFSYRLTIASQKNIDVEISYFNTLKYRNGEYEFAFPMTESGGEGTRSGLDISLQANINAGVKIEKIYSTSHSINVNKKGSRAQITLKTNKRITNRKFILRYQLAGDKLKAAFLTYRDKFALLLQPPKNRAKHDSFAFANVKINWEGIRAKELYPKKLPKIYAGKSVIITGSYQGRGHAVIQVSGTLGGVTYNYSIPVDLNGKNISCPGIELLWAKNKLNDLLDLQSNARFPEIKREAINLAMQYNLLCPLTAFLIVDTWEKIGNKEPEAVIVGDRP